MNLTEELIKIGEGYPASYSEYFFGGIKGFSKLRSLYTYKELEEQFLEFIKIA